MQIPFLALLATPWLLGALVVAVMTRRRLLPRSRFLLVSGIAALGLAPGVGFHLSMMPAYLLIFPGYISPVEAITSFLITLGLLVLAGFGISRLRRRGKQPVETGEIKQPGSL